MAVAWLERGGLRFFLLKCVRKNPARGKNKKDLAFYGETGAGKSTLIECLRLFFKEPGKMDQQEHFKRLYANMKNYRGSERAELEKLQDGAIIGDGRSDSTLKTKSYTLKHNNQNFAKWINKSASSGSMQI